MLKLALTLGLLIAAPAAHAGTSVSLKATAPSNQSPVQQELSARYEIHLAEVLEIQERAEAAFVTAQNRYDEALANINVPPTGSAEELNRRVGAALRERGAAFEQITGETNSAYEASVLSYVTAANAICQRHTAQNCLWNP